MDKRRKKKTKRVYGECLYELDKFRVKCRVREEQEYQDGSMSSVTDTWVAEKVWRPICILVC